MNQTARTFIFTGLVVSILLAMHLLPTIVIDGVELRHVNVLSDVLPEVYQQRDGIDVIPKPVAPRPVRARKAADNDSLAQQTAGEEYQPDTENKLADEGLIIDYSEGTSGGMAHFYEQLSHAVSHQVVRIAYYGDSFVEGDIVTADLRELLQDRFGGSGVGWVDCTDRLKGFRRTVKVKGVGFKEYEVVQKPYSHKVEGIAQRYFVPHENARTWASGTNARKHVARWQQASLFFRTEGGMSVTTFADNDTIGTQYVEGSTQVQSLRFEKEGIATQLRG